MYTQLDEKGWESLTPNNQSSENNQKSLAASGRARPAALYSGCLQRAVRRCFFEQGLYDRAVMDLSHALELDSQAAERPLAFCLRVYMYFCLDIR